MTMGFLQRVPLPYVPTFVLFVALLITWACYMIPANRELARRNTLRLLLVAWPIVGLVAVQGSYQDVTMTGYSQSYGPDGQQLPVVPWLLTIVICLVTPLVAYAAIRAWVLRVQPLVTAMLFAATVCCVACAEWDVMYSKMAASTVPWNMAYVLLETIAVGILIVGVTVSIVRHYRPANNKKRKPLDFRWLRSGL
jgi:hypothetical protein